MNRTRLSTLIATAAATLALLWAFGSAACGAGDDTVTVDAHRTRDNADHAARPHLRQSVRMPFFSFAPRG